MNPDESPLEQVLRRLSDQLRGEFANTLELTQRIKAAVDAYARAVEADLAARYARRLGMDAPEALRAPAAARALLESVRAIPELASSDPGELRSGDASSHAAAGPSASTAAQGAALEPVTPRANVPTAAATTEPQPVSSVFATSANRAPSPEALELITKFKSISFEEMSDELFHAYAQEYAARARELQDKALAEGTGTDELGFVIRKLTAMVHERGLEGVYGLSRRHVGPWADRITRARVQRERIEARQQQARNGTTLTQKVLRAVPNPPASTATSTPASRDSEDEGADEEAMELPHMHDLAKRAEIVIIGGVAKQEKVNWLSKVGVEVSWVPADGHGFLDALARRITEGRVGALIVLEQLVYHHQLDPLLEAARRVRLPVAYAGKGGKGSLKRALQELEAMHQQRADTQPAKSSG